MASFVKYRMYFKDDFGQSCRVFILAQNWLNPSIALQPDANPVRISWKGEDEAIDQTIIQSEAVINIILDKNNEVADDFMNIQEGQFAVIIEQWNEDETVRNYKWIGQLIPDYVYTDISNVQSKVSLKAICPLSLMKGKEYLSPLGKYYTGIWDLGHFIIPQYPFLESGFNDVMFPLIATRVITNISLTPDYQTNFLTSIGAYAESFYNSDGRPLTMYENIERIGKAFFMRCFFDDGVLNMIDPLVYPTHSSTPIKTVTYKDHENYNADTDALLLGNEEVVKMLPSYREAKTEFSYREPTGILTNGLMKNWVSYSGGYYLSDWTPNDILETALDYYLRRVGNGRAERPYGLKFINKGEQIAARSQFAVRTGDVIKIDTRVKILKPYKGYNADEDRWYDVVGHNFYLSVVVMNLAYPSQSYKLEWSMSTERYYWDLVDIEGTRFDTHNEWDFDVSTDIYNKSLESVSNIQEVSIELPPIAAINEGDDVAYRLFIKTFTPGASVIPGSPGLSYEVTENPSEIYGVIASVNGQRGASKEVSYVTRKNKNSLKQISKDIDLQTADTISISGALLSMVSYSIGGDTFQPNFLQKLYRYGVPNQYNLRLSEINSVSNMWINDPNQYKIDMRVKSRLIKFSSALDLSRLYNPLRPATSKYQHKFIANTMTWDMRKCEYQITAISTKLNPKSWTVGLDEPTDIQDLLEHYKI